MTEWSPFRYQRADDSPGFLLWKLTTLWQGRVTAALEPFGLTQTQYAVLASLRWFEEHGEQPNQRHLGEHARIDKMTLSKAVRRLEAAGLVSRQPASHDARATEVRFTVGGRRVIGQAVVAVEDADETFFAGLDGHRLRTWLSLTRDVVEHNAQRIPSAE